MTALTCQYCGEEAKAGMCCSHCGARNFEPSVQEITRTQPYFLGGYIVWDEYDHGMDCLTKHFYKGDHYEGSIRITRDVYEAKFGKEGVCVPDSFWLDLFSLEIGEKIQPEYLRSREFVFTVERIQ